MEDLEKMPGTQMPCGCYQTRTGFKTVCEFGVGTGRVTKNYINSYNPNNSERPSW